MTSPVAVVSYQIWLVTMTPADPSEQDDDGRLQYLEQRVEKLETTLSTLREDNKKLRATVAQQEKTIAQQQGTIEQQQETIARLRARLRWYENPNTPPSRRFPGGPNSPDTDDEEHGDQSPTGETNDEDTDGQTDTEEGAPDAGEGGRPFSRPRP